MERALHTDLHETQTGNGREPERERGARPRPAQGASKRAVKEEGSGEARLPRRGGICASKRPRRAKFGWGLDFPSWRRHPSSQPVRKPKLSSATPRLAAAASAPRSGPAGPGAAAARPPARLPGRPALRRGSPAGCSAAAQPGARASSPGVEAKKFGRPRPAPRCAPGVQPRSAPPGGAPPVPARPPQPCRPSCPSPPRS